jgi:hypothetical protein
VAAAAKALLLRLTPPAWLEGQKDKLKAEREAALSAWSSAIAARDRARTDAEAALVAAEAAAAAAPSKQAQAAAAAARVAAVERLALAGALPVPARPPSPPPQADPLYFTEPVQLLRLVAAMVKEVAAAEAEGGA